MTETITTLKIEDVYPNPKHYREVKADATALLAASIAVAGQLEPIRVWKNGDIYIIDSGHHRHAAMKSLGMETIDTIVQEEDEAGSATVMVACNLHTSESEIERSRGTQLLLSTGVRPLEAAALIGDKQDRISMAARGLAVVADPVACEDLTLDRLVAIADFEDDQAAVESLVMARESDWRRVYDRIRLTRELAAAIANAKAYVASVGVELVESGDGLRYVDRCSSKPEGALYARIQPQNWDGTAGIVWYADAGEEDPAEAAEREEQGRIQAELTSASGLRLAYIAQRIDMCAHLRKLAEVAWEGDADREEEDLRRRTPARSDNLDGTPLAEVNGFTARVTVSILANFEGCATRILSQPDSYWMRLDGAAVVRYLEALAADGYTSTETETARLALVKRGLKGGEQA